MFIPVHMRDYTYASVCVPGPPSTSTHSSREDTRQKPEDGGEVGSGQVDALP